LPHGLEVLLFSLLAILGAASRPADQTPVRPEEPTQRAKRLQRDRPEHAAVALPGDRQVGRDDGPRDRHGAHRRRQVHFLWADQGGRADGGRVRAADRRLDYARALRGHGLGE